MDVNELGSTGLRVAPVALGTGSIGEMFGPVSVEEAVRVVHWAIDHGITLIDTSTYYGSAEERLGIALAGRRDSVILATKAGRFGFDEFDFSARRIRQSLEHSLSVMKTDHVDVFHLHDVEHVPLDRVLTDGFATLQALKDEGKCRFVGMTGYPLPMIERVLRETDVDVVLNYAGATLLDSSLTEVVLPIAAERGVGVISAAAVALGLLTPGGTNILIDHPATPEIIRSTDRMRALAAERGADISFVANQYAIQRSGAATTVVGTSKVRHLESAIRAAEQPIDVELEQALLALRPPVGRRRWTSGLAENNR